MKTKMRYLYIILFSNLIFAQQIQKVDFKSVFGKILIDPIKKEIFGQVKYEFDLLQTTDTVYIDAQKMQFENVKLNNEKISFVNSTKKLAIYQNLKLGKNILAFNYICYPKQAIYFNNFNNNWQIWTQGQGKYTSNWFPSFDDVNEKLIFNLDVSFDSNYQVISNGVLENSFIVKFDKSKVWQYRMQKPMSSYLLMLTIGKYENNPEVSGLKSKSGIPLEFFIEPEDLSKFESTYKYSKEIFDFFETEIGIKYPWQIYKQVPVRDFLYAGMENTSATIFAREFVVDSIAFNDQNYIDVNAHELAHQWFGNLITAKSGKHHWLQEGFATYYALLAEKKILGEDYFYNILYEITQEIKASENTDSTPILNEKASSMTFYKKGAFALFVLENEIGQKNFRKSVKNYLKKYSFKSVETNDFLNEVKKVCDFDIDKFSREWLESSSFDYNKANELLLKNETITGLFNLQKLRKVDLETKKAEFEKVLKSAGYYSLKEEILYQLSSEKLDLKQNLIVLALNTNDLKVRQIVASSLTEIPESFREKYETLLIDSSYKTKEIAFLNLISNFPDRKIEYLNSTKNISGFNDKSFEMLWVFYALSSSNYIENPEELLSKLSNYTSNNFEFSIRQNAFEYLKKIDNLSIQNLEDLLDCCLLPNWRNAKWSKDFLKEILKDLKVKNEYLTILPNLKAEKQTMLNRFLNEKK
jgi:aminopeptidase N